MSETTAGAPPSQGPKAGALNAFRRRRGKILARKIRDLALELGRPVTILDAGGRRDYWKNVGLENIAAITLVNSDSRELERTADNQKIFEDIVGDARKLNGIADNAYDLYHSNSVIEHVGSWQDMEAMSREALRVAPHGWVQTPAWEFPLEPHFRVPFMHWFGFPAQASLLRVRGRFRRLELPERRRIVERVNLLSKREFAQLFVEADISAERILLLPKSYIAVW